MASSYSPSKAPPAGGQADTTGMAMTTQSIGSTYDEKQMLYPQKLLNN